MDEKQTYFGPWGEVPPDADVQPFTSLNPHKRSDGRDNRKHHFVSVTYMEGFANKDGRVQVYRSEAPTHPHPMRPKATGFENNYYSQPLPEGGLENHRFEDLWWTIETVWPQTVRALEQGRLAPAISLNITGMMTIMRARVPATRDRIALMLEAKLRSQFQVLEELGALPPEYQRYAGQMDTVPIGINPHETLLAMNDEFKAFGDLCFQIGFEVLHNRTDLPFITSDNPVCIYDVDDPVDVRAPYDISGRYELLFPVSATMAIRGLPSILPYNTISKHRDIEDPAEIATLNTSIAQFSYRITIAPDRSSDDTVARYAGVVPTIETEVRRQDKNIEIHWRHVFGPRPALNQYIDTPAKAERLERRMAAKKEPGEEG